MGQWKQATRWLHGIQHLQKPTRFHAEKVNDFIVCLTKNRMVLSAFQHLCEDRRFSSSKKSTKQIFKRPLPDYCRHNIVIQDFCAQPDVKKACNRDLTVNQLVRLVNITITWKGKTKKLRSFSKKRKQLVKEELRDLSNLTVKRSCTWSRIQSMVILSKNYRSKEAL